MKTTPQLSHKSRPPRSAEQVAQSITEAEHRDILEIQMDKYRHVFFDLLGSEKTPRSASFFYGAKDPSVPTDQAAKEASDASASENPDLISDIKWLSEKAIYAIYRFAEFPKDYEDPLKGGFTDDEIESLRSVHPALHEYLSHRKEWSSIAGKLLKRQSS